MSYQAITDIIVSTATLQNLQLSNTVKDSPKTTQDNSFAELVSFYKNETDSKPNEVSSEKPVEQSSLSKEEENKEEAVQIKDDAKESSKVKTDEVKSEDSKEIKENPKTVNLDTQISKTQVSSEEKKSSKVDDTKKLTKKEFSKIEELTEKEQFLEDVSKFAVNVQNKINEKNDVKTEKNLVIDSEVISVEENQTLTANIQMNANVETDSQNFDFNQKESSEKKQFTLDKTGKITVEDLRTEKPEGIAFEKKSDLKISEIKQTNENTAVMTMDLNQEVNSDVLSLNTQSASANGSNFQAMLNNQIQNSVPEFVKAGNLVLKDNNQGTINLVIHPDDLGNVKIHLSLDGNKISGHITVATKEALQVFKDNAETLREAFIKSGFDAANFDVAFNNSGSFNQNMEFAQQNNGSDIFAKNVYNNSKGSLDSELEAIFENSEDISNYSVNIIA